MVAVTKYYEGGYIFPEVSTYIFGSKDSAANYVRTEANKELNYQINENGFVLNKSIFMRNSTDWSFAEIDQDKHYGDGNWIQWIINEVY